MFSEDVTRQSPKNQASCTPGPWTVAKLTYPAGQDVSFEVMAGQRFIGQTLMREIIRENDLIAEDEANARLMATAPDLLAALKSLIHHHIILDECGEEVRAAIAKAEGRTP